MLSLALEYRDEFQAFAAWLICFAALIWGGGPERAIALTWLVLFKGLDKAAQLIWGTQFLPDQLGMFFAANDLLALAAFVTVALHANRMYTLWIASFQVLAVLAHMARELADQISPISYAIMAIAPGYFQLGLMAGGLILHVRRKRSHGHYRDWRQGETAAAWQAFLSSFGHRK